MENSQMPLNQQGGPKQPIFLKAGISYVISIMLAFVLASPAGKLYDTIFKPKRIGGSLLFPDFGPSLEGFIYGYVLIVSLLVTLFLKKNKEIFYAWLIGTGWLIILFLLGGGWNELLILLILSLIGYLVGLGILYLKNRITTAKAGS
jgi:hypothetical protein